MPDREKPSLLISCLGKDTGGGLFFYDGTTVDQIDAISSTGLAVAGGEFGRLLWSAGQAGSVGELLVYDRRGVKRYLRVDSLLEPHDLTWHQGSFVAVSTMSNSIVWISASGNVTSMWRAEGDGDAWHLNSLEQVNGRLFAAAFGRFSTHREWSEGRSTGKGMIFDVATGEDVVTGLSCPHDPRLVDGLWLVCNSTTGELLAVEPSAGTVERRTQLAGWTRGLAVDGDLLYVGESADRAAPTPEDLASVAILDRRSFAIVDRLQLPCQEVFDVIAVPPALVAGVRRGFRTNSLRTAELDQHALFATVGKRPVRLWATGEPLPASACKVRVEARIPEELPARTIHDIGCLVGNAGSAILVSAPPNPVQLSYKWIPTDGGEPLEGMRTQLPEALPPAGEICCRLALETPHRPGDYSLVITLVQEGVAWFVDLDSANALRARVRISARGDSATPFIAEPC
jgi:hypothetical protein